MPVHGDLPDINVWLALLNPWQVHQAAAAAYWEAAASARILLCRVTQLGILRLTTNKAVMGGTPYTVSQAWAALQSLAELPEGGLQADVDGVDDSMRQFTRQLQFRVADWTNAYLAALAFRAHLRVVTFDRGFLRFLGVGLLTL